MLNNGFFLFSHEKERTKAAYLWTFILNAPFWAIFNMLPFILVKDLGASALQITVLVTLKPAVSLLSVYWSDYVKERADRLVPNVVLGSVLSKIPFLFLPWITNIWMIIGIYAFYMLLQRGVVPAWMELLKLGVEKESRSRIVSYGITLSYVASAIFPVFFGWMMDDYDEAWRIIFPIVSLFSLVSLYFQLQIPAQEENKAPKRALSLLAPWKTLFKLLRERRDFFHFQMGFMLGGFGLIILQPILPDFYTHVLNLNYKELGLATNLCKGVGFALASPFWANWISRAPIFRFTSLVAFVSALFALQLLFAQSLFIWLFAAYISYGFMQAGSQLVWKLSGPIFSPDEDSSAYTSVNILMVGIRGLIANPLGGLIAYGAGLTGVMLLSVFLCLSGSLYLFRAGQRMKLVEASP